MCMHPTASLLAAALHLGSVRKTTLDTHLTALDMTRHAPDITRHAPDSTRHTPDSTRRAPNSTASTPQIPDNLPDNGKWVLEQLIETKDESLVKTMKREELSVIKLRQRLRRMHEHLAASEGQRSELHQQVRCPALRTLTHGAE